MGCGQSKDPLTNQKPVSELLTNHIAVEAVAIKMVESVDKIERVEEKDKKSDTEDIAENNHDDGVSKTLMEDPVVMVEAVQDIKEADLVIKEAEMVASMKDSTNQRPGEPMNENFGKDDPPPSYHTLTGDEYYSHYNS